MQPKRRIYKLLLTTLTYSEHSKERWLGLLVDYIDMHRDRLEALLKIGKEALRERERCIKKHNT